MFRVWMVGVDVLQKVVLRFLIEETIMKNDHSVLNLDAVVLVWTSEQVIAQHPN